MTLLCRTDCPSAGKDISLNKVLHDFCHFSWLLDIIQSKVYNMISISWYERRQLSRSASYSYSKTSLLWTYLLEVDREAFDGD